MNMLQVASHKQAAGYFTFDFIDDFKVFSHKKPNAITRFVLRHLFQIRWHPIESAI